MAKSPVFIIGSPRSGTSILVDTLVAAGYNGFREGSFLSLIAMIGGLVDRHFEIFSSGNRAILISNVDKQDLKRRIFDVLRDITLELNPRAPWFDKTGNPEMVLSVPVLQQLWPESTFVFAKRRGIENIVSRLKKFPAHSFEYHCLDWAKNMLTWRTVRAGLPQGSHCEIDQQEIIQFPERVAERLRSFLNLDGDAEQKMAKTFRLNRPQQSEAGSAGRLLSLKSCGWSSHQISAFLEKCRTEMDAYGYSMDESYGSVVNGQAVE